MSIKEKQIEVTSTTENLVKVTKFIEDFLTEEGVPLIIGESINVAIDEIYSNIVKHGYKAQDKKVIVKVAVEKTDEQNYIHLSFIDSAKEFNPLEMEEPDITLSAEERSIGGLGIYMVKKMMDKVSYEYDDGRNILTLTKKYKSLPPGFEDL